LIAASIKHKIGLGDKVRLPALERTDCCGAVGLTKCAGHKRRGYLQVQDLGVIVVCIALMNMTTTFIQRHIEARGILCQVATVDEEAVQGVANVGRVG